MNGPNIDAKSEHFLEKYFFGKHVFTYVLSWFSKVEGSKSRSKIDKKVNKKSMLEKVMQNGSEIIKNDATMVSKSIQNHSQSFQKSMRHLCFKNRALERQRVAKATSIIRWCEVSEPEGSLYSKKEGSF